MSAEVYGRWDDGYVVRRMRRDEIAQVLEWIGALITVSVDLDVAMDVRGQEVDGFYTSAS